MAMDFSDNCRNRKFYSEITTYIYETKGGLSS